MESLKLKYILIKLKKKNHQISQKEFGDEKSNNRGQKSLEQLAEQQAESIILYPVKLSIKNIENILEFSGKKKSCKTLKQAFLAYKK